MAAARDRTAAKLRMFDTPGTKFGPKRRKTGVGGLVVRAGLDAST